MFSSMRIHIVIPMVGMLLLLGGCATSLCGNSRSYAHSQAEPALKIPGGLDHPSPDPAFQIPGGAAEARADGCLAKPPTVLKPKQTDKAQG